MDLADFMDIFPEVKVKSLWNLAKHLGVNIDGEQMIEDVEFAAYWDNKEKRGELESFSQNNAQKVQACAPPGCCLDFAIQLSSLTSIPLTMS